MIKMKVFCVVVAAMFLIPPVSIVQNMEKSINSEIAVNSRAENTAFSLFSSHSIRAIGERTVIVPQGSIYYHAGEEPDKTSRFYPLIATPIASYYEDGAHHIEPLLVQDVNNPSDAVTNFLDLYEPEEVEIIQPGDVNQISVELATKYWKQSDKIMVIENSDDGYELGLMAVPLASYIDIPVIVGDPSRAIEELGCKNAILIGNVSEPSIPFEKYTTREEITQAVIEACKEKFGSVNYIAMADPMDTYPIKIVKDEVLLDEEGCLPGKNSGYTDSIRYDYELPNGTFLIQCNLWFNASWLTTKIKFLGEGIHMGFYGLKGVKRVKPDEGSLFYTDTQAYVPRKGYFEIDVNNLSGEYSVVLWGYGLSKKDYHLKITLKEIEHPGRPQSPFISSLAPYLAATRKGIVIADSNFGKALEEIWGITYRYQKTAWYYNDDNEIYTEAAKAANEANAYAKKVLDETLSQLEEEGCLDGYLENPYLGIIADNNMLPMHYYEANKRYWYELNSQPSDNELANIDNDSSTLELATGRIIGWDAQDVSALIARTLLYDEIIDKVHGANPFREWKNSVYIVNGGDPTIERCAEKNFNDSEDMLKENGYNVYRLRDVLGAPYIAEDILHRVSGSNLILSLAHGRYYRYEYGSQLGSPLRQATQFAVLNVKDMNLGPSAMFVDACIGGTTDGYPLRTSIIATFLHSGFNMMFAPTRCPNIAYDDPYATSLMKFWVKGIVENNLSVGLACMNAKNEYAEEGSQDYYTWEEFVHYTIYGDPAFNPYVPREFEYRCKSSKSK